LLLSGSLGLYAFMLAVAPSRSPAQEKKHSFAIPALQIICPDARERPAVSWCVLDGSFFVFLRPVRKQPRDCAASAGCAVASGLDGTREGIESKTTRRCHLFERNGEERFEKTFLRVAYSFSFPSE
jgi:hypothetical protein